ncbi:MAG: hypothetical protein ACKV19_15660 [Verrucomicrobiales bacterium]
MVVDTDGDGMPDDFEQQYFGSPTGGDPDADADGDGQTNLQEFRAGTNPIDPRSVLRIEEIRREGADIVIRFEAAPGKAYEIWSGTDLIAFHSTHRIVGSIRLARRAGLQNNPKVPFRDQARISWMTVPPVSVSCWKRPAW